MYKLKQMVKRGSAFAGAVGLLAGIGTSAVPVLVHADALNPLTNRSLTLSSSSPGWSYTDGSGNSTYAYPGSGANGQKSSNFYSFNVSSTHTINGFTLQYCINPAGNCIDPGNDATHGSAADDTSSTSDLRVVTSSPSEISSANWTTVTARTEANAPTSGGVKLAHAYSPKMDNSEGNFVVLANGLYSPGWIMTASSQEEGTNPTPTTNVNMIKLTNTMGQSFTAGEHIDVKFFATNTNYITNPGQGSFFVKINDYAATPTGGTGDTDTSGAIDGTETPYTYNAADINPVTGANNVIDGGVTVANVMNESIQIQTKVLETMQFSVGTVDPDTLKGGVGNELDNATGGAMTGHGSCDNILPALAPGDAHNVLYLGDTNNEHALSTQDTYGTHSYWRLSSNSSAGASVYYAGSTLHDTEGDDINPIGTTATVPRIGTEQFGLALDNDATASHFYVNHDNDQNSTPAPGSKSFDYGVDNGTGATNDGALDPSTNADPSLSTGWDNAVNELSAHDPQLYPLVATDGTSGTIDYAHGGFQSGSLSGANSSVFNPALTTANFASLTDTYNNNLKFAFDPDANTHPSLLATENNQVVDCVTAKMRYIANIAAVTPAGIYTTKINYIAAPQY